MSVSRMSAYLRRYGLEVMLFLLAAVVLIPLYLMFVNSLKDLRSAALLDLTLPSVWEWRNYKEVFVQANVLRGYKNSFLISGFVVVCVNLLASMAAFAINRRNSPAVRNLYYLFIIGLIVPVSIIPTIKMLMALHLHNTYAGIVLYYTAVQLPFSVFLLAGFLKTIPRELDEASYLDGCGYFRLYRSVIVPLLKPVLATVSIIVTLGVWNDFFGPFYLISDSTKWSVTMTVFNFVLKYSTNWGLVFADMMLVIAPIILIYALLQRYIIDGMTAGALKS